MDYEGACLGLDVWLTAVHRDERVTLARAVIGQRLAGPVPIASPRAVTTRSVKILVAGVISARSGGEEDAHSSAVRPVARAT